ncbi:arginine synthesis PII-interacting regulator PirA [Myxosarcina sp. GI1(2024)]
MKNTDLEFKQIHRANIIKNIEHRLEVARNANNIQLIEQLEAEKRYLS